MIYSFKTLAIGWAGLTTVLGAGAVALQVTQPPSPVVQAAAAAPIPIPMPPPVAAPGTPPPVVMPPVPFVNSSLLAMLPPVERAVPQPGPRVIHQAAVLPIPPVPPAPPRRYARAEQPRRSVRMYAAAPDYQRPDYDGAEWDQPIAYPRLYARGRPYTYMRTPEYYAW